MNNETDNPTFYQIRIDATENGWNVSGCLTDGTVIHAGSFVIPCLNWTDVKNHAIRILELMPPNNEIAVND